MDNVSLGFTYQDRDDAPVYSHQRFHPLSGLHGLLDEGPFGPNVLLEEEPFYKRPQTGEELTVWGFVAAMVEDCLKGSKEAIEETLEWLKEPKHCIWDRMGKKWVWKPRHPLPFTMVAETMGLDPSWFREKFREFLKRCQEQEPFKRGRGNPNWKKRSLAAVNGQLKEEL